MPLYESPIEIIACIHIGGIGIQRQFLTKEHLYAMQGLKWHSHPDSNGDFSVRSAAVSPLAYGSIEKLKKLASSGPALWLHRARLDSKKPSELYCGVVSRNRSQFVIC